MSNAHILFDAAKAIQEEVTRLTGPPDEGLRAVTQSVILLSVVRNTRGYIEAVSNQINGAYENGWYDACAVMMRRLLETLIIECFEKHNLTAKIKNPAGDFLYLRDLIDRCLQEPSWNLSRNCKQAMPKLKDVGDKSAHSRRYNAHRGDIDPLLRDVRLVVQELIYLALLK
ncbi:MAG: hypothetical protein WCA21_13065 [Terracidiphilus sp.]